MFRNYSIKDYNFKLVAFVVCLTIIGILIIGSAKPSLLTRQLLGLVLGLIGMIVVSLIDYKSLLKLSWPLYAFDLLLLAFVLFAGEVHGGARRWMIIPVIDLQFQPSELSKVIIILFFAGWLEKHSEKLNTLKILIFTAILAAFPLGLVVLEPDLSTTIVTTLIILTLIFLGGLSYKIVIGGLVAIIPVALAGIYMFLNNSSLLIGYQNKRILAWLYPEKYPDEALQQQNSMMAIGSGQLFGKGLNNNDVASLKNGNFISEPQTDFIMAVAGEELGFVGTLVIVVLLLLITIECLLIASKAKDISGKIIAGGIASLIAFQSFVNICVVTGLFPNTGLPLPFVSYGLTSLVTLYGGIGLVLNVGLKKQKYKSGGDLS